MEKLLNLGDYWSKNFVCHEDQREGVVENDKIVAIIDYHLMRLNQNGLKKSTKLRILVMPHDVIIFLIITTCSCTLPLLH